MALHLAHIRGFMQQERMKQTNEGVIESLVYLPSKSDTNANLRRAVQQQHPWYGEVMVCF